MYDPGYHLALVCNMWSGFLTHKTVLTSLMQVFYLSLDSVLLYDEENDFH